MDGGLHWDILVILEAIKEGLKIAAEKFGDQIVSLGVDSWGVDYALVDKSGSMLRLENEFRALPMII